MKLSSKIKCTGVGLCCAALMFSFTAGASATQVATTYIGEAEAKAIAFEHAGITESSAEYLQCKMDRDDGFMEYDVKFWADGVEYEYEISASTGTILDYDYDYGYNYTPPQIPDSTAYIGEVQAKTIALEHAQIIESSVSYIYCALDYDDGVAEYNVEFWVDGVEYDYDISAKTGTILKYDHDNEYTYSPPISGDSTTYITEANAKSIVAEHSGLSEAEMSFIMCKLDFDDGVPEYEIEFLNGNVEYDYDINAITGEITSYDYDIESKYTSTPQEPVVDNSTNVPTITETTYITAEQAKSIALQDAGVNEADIRKFDSEFDYDDGQAEYEVEWEIGKTEYEYTISATDGTIWERDVEYDD